MFRKSSKYQAFIFFRMLIVMVPALSYGQHSKVNQKLNGSYNYIEKASNIPVIRRAMLDSVNEKLKMLDQYNFRTGDTSKAGRIATIKSNLRNFEISNLSTSALMSKLPGFYSLKQPISNVIKGTSLLSDIQFSNQALYDNFYLSNKKFFTNSELTFRNTVASVPLSFQFNYTYPAFPGQNFSTVYKMSFDKESLLSGVRQQLNHQFDPKKLLLQDLNFKELFHHYAENKLLQIKASVTSLSNQEQLIKGINQIAVEEFLYLTKQQIKEKLIDRALMDSLNVSKQNLIREISFNTDSFNSTLLNQRLALITSRIIDADATVNKVLAAKNDFETTGLNYNLLINYQNIINKNIDSISTSTAFVQDASKKLLKLKGLSKLFIYVREMNIGKFSSNWSEHSMSGVLSSGIGGSYIKNNKFLGFNFSNIQSLGWIKDNQFVAGLQQPEAAIQALRIGKGDLSSTHSHITLANANVKNINPQQALYSFIPRNIFVGSFSKSASLGTYGNIETELSKSSAQHNNGRNFQNENQQESRLAFKHLGEDFFQTLSVGIKYSASFQAIHFKPSFFANYSGLGYTNPLSSSQSRGSIYFGSNTSNSFFSNKLIVYSRFSNRINRTGLINNQNYNQLQGSLSAKYKLSRKLRIGLNWTYSDLSKRSQELHEKLYFSNRVYSDATFSGKIRGTSFMQFINAGYQNISMMDMPLSTQGKTIWINTATNIALQKGSLLMNVQLYNQLDKSIMQGDLLTSELGWSFIAFKKINLTSSFNYLNQQQIARQLGIRQTISASLKDRLNMSLFADLRKDIITNTNNFLFPNTRGELIITYQIIK